MTRILAVFLALAAATTAAHAAPYGGDTSQGREVISIDHGPGQRLSIVRNGSAEMVSWTGGREALDYVDGSGARVQVYADHAVSRSEIEADIARAEREGAEARAEGRREAAEGRREAEQARMQGERDRAEAFREVEAGRREAELGRREAERARIEGERAAEEGRREAERARVEAEAAASDLR